MAYRVADLVIMCADQLGSDRARSPGSGTCRRPAQVLASGTQLAFNLAHVGMVAAVEAMLTLDGDLAPLKATTSEELTVLQQLLREALGEVEAALNAAGDSSAASEA